MISLGRYLDIFHLEFGFLCIDERQIFYLLNVGNEYQVFPKNISIKLLNFSKQRNVITLPCYNHIWAISRIILTDKENVKVDIDTSAKIVPVMIKDSLSHLYQKHNEHNDMNQHEGEHGNNFTSILEIIANQRNDYYNILVSVDVCTIHTTINNNKRHLYLKCNANIDP